MPRPATKRARRPSEEIRTLLLDAARELFLRNGYEATTTKEIALAAGVAEPLIFSNFGSKADLFRQTIVAPFEEFARSYVQLWQAASPDATDWERIESFVRGLLDLTERNRAVLLSAIAAGRGDERAAAKEVAAAFKQIYAIDESLHGWHFDAASVLAATVGMVMSTVLLDELVFPDGTERPSREVMVEELTRLILHGVSHEPPARPPRRHR
jgi:AcrR family transcriptional regulator